MIRRTHPISSPSATKARYSVWWPRPPLSSWTPKGTGRCPGRPKAEPGPNGIPHAHQPVARRVGPGSRPGDARIFGRFRLQAPFRKGLQWERDKVRVTSCPGGSVGGAFIVRTPSPQPSPHGRGSLPRLWRLFGISREGRGDIFRRRLPLERKPLSPLAAFPLRSQHIGSLQHEGQRLRSRCEQSTDIRTRHLTQIGLWAELGESLR